MKIIDLLNKIANGEQPKKIVKNNETLIWDEERHTYQGKDYSSICWDWYVEENKLNDEIEILDEKDKDIPLIPDDELYEFNMKEKILDLDKLNYNFKVLKEKINQVIEVINNEMD